MELPALLHSVSYSGTWGQPKLTVPAFIDKTAELGYDGVLLMAKRPHLSVLDYGPRERERLREHIAKRGLRHVVVAGYNNFSADAEHGDVPHLEIQVHYISELARLTHDIGGSLVRIFTAYDHPAVPHTAQWEVVIRAIRECAQRASEWGVTIGVQNHHDVAVGFEALHDLVSSVNEPNCKALFDAWAPALHGANLDEAAALLAPLTAHTTVANYVRRPRYRYNPALVNYDRSTDYIQAVRMSAGFIDYPAFWQRMVENGFRGSVAYEMCSPLLEGSAEEMLDRHAEEFLTIFRAFRESVAMKVDDRERVELETVPPGVL